MNKKPNPIPEHLAGKQPFEAPVGYFDSFPRQMAYRIEGKQELKRSFDFEYLFRPVAITTVLLFMLATAVLTFRNYDGADAEAQHSGETLLSYVEQEGILDEMSEDELLEHVYDENFVLPESEEDSLSNAFTEELAEDDFIDFETYDEL